MFNQFNNSSPEQNIDSENVVKSRYSDVDEMQLLNLLDKGKSLSFFHINACSLNKMRLSTKMQKQMIMNIFVIRLTNEKRLTLFLAGTIIRDPHC